MTWKERISPSDRSVRGLGNRTAGTWYVSTMRQGTARIRVCLNSTCGEGWRARASTAGFTIFPYYVALVLNSSYVGLLL